MNFVQTSTNNWTVQIGVPDSTTGTTDAGTADLTFGPTATDTTAADGTVSQIAADATDPGTVTTTGNTIGGSAKLQFTTNFGNGPQTISLNLGTYGTAGGVTQFAGTNYSLLGLTQDGVPPGSYTGVTTQANGNVVVNYDNGQTATVAQIPLTTFEDPDALQSQDGQSFTATSTSGNALAKTVGTNGAGSLVINSVEGSNVDIATEFSALIVAQQAYSSNAKVITTANQMLQATLQMVT
jgi:flagellar hook protein FlgE